jgi:phosphoribosyl 1,2-cyclic phosphate phosphodiesterase
MRPSILVQLSAEATLLVDTTPELRVQALTYGLRRVDAVLYTHSHADHVAGFDDLRRFNTINGTPMPIYADRSTVHDLRRMFGYVFDPDTPVAGGIPEVRLWTLGGAFCFGGQEVVPVPIMHGTRPIFGFRFGRFAYLTDCSEVPASSAALLRDLDVLVLDAVRHQPHPTHFTLEQATTVARQICARQTYFTHISHDLGYAETMASLPAGMALAYDGLTLELPEGRV